MINTIDFNPIRITNLELIITKKCSNSDCLHPLAKINNRVYPVKDFNIAKSRKGGYQPVCKYCSKDLSRFYRTNFWGKASACSNRANARVENSKVSTEDLFLLFLAQDGKCVYTDKILTYREMSLDHLKQVSKGGDNRIENLVWCFEPANLARNGAYSHKDLFYLMGKTEDQIAAIWSRIAYVHQTFLELKSLLTLTPEFNLQQYALTYN